MPLLGDGNTVTGIRLRDVVIGASPTYLQSRGRVMVSIPIGQKPRKNGDVFVWLGDSKGSHIKGGFEARRNRAHTAIVPNARFIGDPDKNGIIELEIWPA